MKWEKAMLDETLRQAGLFSMEIRKGYYAANITAGQEDGGFTILRKTLSTGDD